MSFYEDLKKDLEEAIKMEHGEIEAVQVEGMPAQTFRGVSKDAKSEEETKSRG